MMRAAALLALSALVVTARARPAEAQTTSIDLMIGSAYNVPTPLTVRQSGYPDLTITAHYDTKPFGPYAPYYTWRLDVWRKDRAWELQHVHHRIFLANPTPEIESFSIHYGYNYILFGRAWRGRTYVVHASGGVVITSPASTIRGHSLNTRDPGILDVGYRVTGVGAALAVSREWTFATHAYVLADGAILAGTVSVPVVDGHARAPNFGFHGHIGLGLKFKNIF
jgi:hypothetical protein